MHRRMRLEVSHPRFLIGYCGHDGILLHPSQDMTDGTFGQAVIGKSGDWYSLINLLTVLD
jgi:hypothetical protein